MTRLNIVILSLSAALAHHPAQAASIVLRAARSTRSPATRSRVQSLSRTASCGASVPAPRFPDGATRIDVTGLHVYPGLFDALGQMGLVEVNAVAATVDHTELGSYNPTCERPRRSIPPAR